MYMNKATLTLVLSATLGAAGLAHAGNGNPFAMEALNPGYQIAATDTVEGKCGGKKAMEAKCGGDKAMEGKAKEGKCGTSKTKAMEGKCGGSKAKAMDGKCGGDKAKAMEGKCGGSK